MSFPCEVISRERVERGVSARRFIESHYFSGATHEALDTPVRVQVLQLLRLPRLPLLLLARRPPSNKEAVGNEAKSASGVVVNAPPGVPRCEENQRRGLYIVASVMLFEYRRAAVAAAAAAALALLDDSDARGTAVRVFHVHGCGAACCSGDGRRHCSACCSGVRWPVRRGR